MAFQEVPDVASAKLVYNFAGGPDINTTIYVRDTTLPWNQAKLSALGDTIQAWWDAEVQPLQVDDITLATIELVDQENEFGQRVTKTVGLAGSIISTPAPGAVAAIVNFIGDPGNPPRQGRIFHPGLSEAQITDAALDATFASDLASAYDALSTAIAAAVATEAQVIVSRYQGSELVAASQGQTLRRAAKRETATSNTLASVSVPLRYGVQRRRRPSPF